MPHVVYTDTPQGRRYVQSIHGEPFQFRALTRVTWTHDQGSAARWMDTAARWLVRTLHTHVGVSATHAEG